MSDPVLNDGDVRIWQGDAIEQLDQMPESIAQTCVTSPPYWGLRDYGVEGQLGLEQTPDEYVARMVQVFREVRRVLRDDGTLWLNLGDSYASDTKGSGGPDCSSTLVGTKAEHNGQRMEPIKIKHGVKNKDLVGIPWRVAFALQADGWYLRSDIIWAKPNPMPESITDRPTKAHEYVFLLSKSARYYYDAEAIREPAETNKWPGIGPQHAIARDRNEQYEPMQAKTGRNSRSVWQIATKPYAEAHFATFPPELPERCIKAGSREGDTVLDPFMGSGTTAYVARHLGRHAIGVELNADYIAIARKRLGQQSLLTQ